jgi:hypothetical protein
LLAPALNADYLIVTYHPCFWTLLLSNHASEVIFAHCGAMLFMHILHALEVSVIVSFSVYRKAKYLRGEKSGKMIAASRTLHHKRKIQDGCMSPY